MKIKKHEKPEIRVIRLNEASAKFLAASYSVGNYDVQGTSNGVGITMGYSRDNANGWF